MLLDFEKDSGRRISGICRAITGLILIVILLHVIHVFNISPDLYPTMIVVSIISMTPTFFLNFEYAFQKNQIYGFGTSGDNGRNYVFDSFVSCNYYAR